MWWENMPSEARPKKNRKKKILCARGAKKVVLNEGVGGAMAPLAPPPPPDPLLAWVPPEENLRTM